MAGSGNVESRGNGSWRLTVRTGKGKDNKYNRIRKTVKAKNITAARKLLAEFIAEIESGDYVAPSYTLFGDYVNVWKKETTKKATPSTMESYTYSLDKHILPAFSHLKMEDVSHVHVKNYLEALEGQGLASATIKKHYNILSGIFKLATLNDSIKKNPMEKVSPPSVTSKPGNVYNTDELVQLFQLLNKEENRQQVLLIKLALKTGMRKGELLALQWDDVNFDTNTIHVRHSLSYTKEQGYLLKEPKTKGSIRKVAPPKKLMDELRKHKLSKSMDRMEAKELWQGGKHFFVFSSEFGKPLHRDVPNKWWKRFLSRTRFKQIRFHDLRHTAATDLINRGANIHSISKRLGHANIKTTLNIYGHYLEEADQKIADMLNEDYV